MSGLKKKIDKATVFILFPSLNYVAIPSEKQGSFNIINELEPRAELGRILCGMTAVILKGGDLAFGHERPFLGEQW